MTDVVIFEFKVHVALKPTSFSGLWWPICMEQTQVLLQAFSFTEATLLYSMITLYNVK